MPVTELNRKFVRANSLERLRNRYCGAVGVQVDTRDFPESKPYQPFHSDPDGPTIELKFLGSANASGWCGDDYSKTPRGALRELARKNAAKQTKASTK